MSTITEIRKLQADKYKKHIDDLDTTKIILETKINLLLTKLDDSIKSLTNSKDIISVNLYLADIKFRIIQNQDIILNNNLTNIVREKLDDIIFIISNNEKLRFDITSKGYEKHSSKKIIEDLKSCYIAINLDVNFDTILMDTSKDEELAIQLSNEWQ